MNNSGEDSVLSDDIGALPDFERLLGQFRPYLRALAENVMPRELQQKFDPSDLVQETLWRGYRQFAQYRGTTERELTAWLTEILHNYLADVRRGLTRGRRDLRREQPLVEVACTRTLSASDILGRTETADQLRQAMSELPNEYRMVLQLRQDDRLTFPEIGARMNRSADAARMLWGRAVIQLGKLLEKHAE